ncbi:MAG TPA: hypothetical protein VK614_14620 [Allosphingosinicella sp.]|nr:hypothetical protein [Allosphingosinicella sp.]
MPTNIIDVAAYEEANEVLVDALKMARDFRRSATPSVDPASDFKRAGALASEINDLIGQLARLELRQIDDAIAQSGLVDDINELSKEAKHEAERLGRVTKTIARITKVFDMVAGVVTKIAGLPFL